MQKEFSKTDLEFRMFADYYKLVSRFYIPEPDNPQYWQDAIDACSKFSSNYTDSTFASRLAMDYLGFLNEKVKIMKGK